MSKREISQKKTAYVLPEELGQFVDRLRRLAEVACVARVCPQGDCEQNAAEKCRAEIGKDV